MAKIDGYLVYQFDATNISATSGTVKLYGNQLPEDGQDFAGTTISGNSIYYQANDTLKLVINYTSYGFNFNEILRLGPGGVTGTVELFGAPATPSPTPSPTPTPTPTVNNYLFLWGINEAGQLGDNTTANRNFPSEVYGDGNTWHRIDAGKDFFVGVKRDGTLWMWGKNYFGQIGDNSIIDKSSPVQNVAGINAWIIASAGDSHTGAIENSTPSPTPSASATPTPSPSPTPSSTPTPSPTMSPTPIPTVTPTQSPLPTNIPTRTPTPTPSPTPSFTPSPTPSPSQTSSPTPTPSPTATPLPTYTPRPTKAPGFLYTWGTNNLGQNGDNTIVARSLPNYTTEKTKVWSIVSVGYNLMSAIKSDGTLWSWGYNFTGCLGDNTSVHRSSPVQTIALGSNWRSVSVGGAFIAATKTDNTLWLWGSGVNGQLGNAITYLNMSSPVQTIAFGNDWLDAAAGEYHTVALKTNGTVWCWGANANGQIGSNQSADKVSSPVQIYGGGSTWVQVSAGQRHSAGIKSNGTLWLWGQNAYGQLGNNTTIPLTLGYGGVSSPVQTISGGTNWKSVACAGFSTAAIKTDGSLWVWGLNTSGQLGINTISNRSSPVRVGTATTWSQINGGAQNFYALKTDGSLWTVGQNQFGNLGDGTLISKSSPIQIGTNIGNWIYAAGFQNGAAISNSTPAPTPSPTVTPTPTPTTTLTPGPTPSPTPTLGSYKLWTWGFNEYGQLGRNTQSFVVIISSPVQVGTNANWSVLAASQFSFHAIKNDNTLWAWGQNLFGQLGINSTQDKSSPVQVGTNANWVKLSANGNTTHKMAIKTDSTLWGWGVNFFGNLGNNSTVDTSSPVQIGTGTNYYQVDVGSYFTAAIKLDGTLWTWGKNDKGQLGTNNVRYYSSPVQTIAGGNNWGFLACGGAHVLATKFDNSLWVWGQNYYGELGINNRLDQYSPIQLGNDTNWSKISTSNVHSMAIKADGTLWAWGSNQFGQLGDNTRIHRSSPIQVGSNTNWKSVFAAHRQTYAIKNDNSFWAWGENNQGNLGTNNTVYYSSPVQVGSLNDWYFISTTFGSHGALRT